MYMRIINNKVLKYYHVNLHQVPGVHYRIV